MAKEYHPKTIKEEYYDLMKELGIKCKKCSNETIKKFFVTFTNINCFLKENINLIEQLDIKDFLVKGQEIIDKITNL